MPAAIIILTLMTATVIIVLASALCYNIVQGSKQTTKHHANIQTQRFETRVSSVEKHLADVQDIVIAIDDRLKRSIRQPTLEKHV